MTGAERVLREVARDLDEAGLTGWCLARDLDTGEEVGTGADVPVPLASLVKVPLALCVLERVHRGDLDGAGPLLLDARDASLPGGVGSSRFLHPARVALVDAVYLSVALSDNVATDALFALVTPEEVTARMVALGLRDLDVRHPIGDLSRTPAEALPDDLDLAHALAAAGGTAGGGHRVRQLDTSRSSAGTARAMVDLLALLWAHDGPLVPEVAGPVRRLMGENVHRQRLWPDLASDAATWSSKTGTLLNLRHEAGVVEHAGDERYAVAVLTESRVAAAVQPAAEAAMGQVGRRLRDHLRAGRS